MPAAQPYLDAIEEIAAPIFGKRLKSVSSSRDRSWQDTPTIHVSMVFHDKPSMPIRALSALVQQFESAVSERLDHLEPDTVFVFHYATASELADLALDD